MSLLAASYFFYAYGSGIYVVLIMITTLVDYLAARAMGAPAAIRAAASCSCLRV